MNQVVDVTIDAGHPSLSGHFPGHPVVPGVVILDKVREAIFTRHPGFYISGFPNVKFLQPLLPMQEFQIEIDEQKGRYRFTCRRNDTLIAQGEIRLASL